MHSDMNTRAAVRVLARSLGVVILLFGSSVPFGAAAQTHKIAVYVSATSNDPVGEQLVYELREQRVHRSSFQAHWLIRTHFSSLML